MRVNSQHHPSRHLDPQGPTECFDAECAHGDCTQILTRSSLMVGSSRGMGTAGHAHAAMPPT